MIRYTDLDDALIIRGLSLSGADSVIVTYRQAQRVQANRYQTDTTYVQVDVEPTVSVVGGDSYLSAELTQDQTALFSVDSGNPVFVQVNYVMDGKRHATKAKAIPVFENLHQEVIADD